MTDGMKSGAGSDPFASNSDDNNGSGTTKSGEQETGAAESPSNKEGASTDHSESHNSSVNSDRESLPYIFRRNGVKEDRRMVQYFLQADTEHIEDEATHAVEQELGTDVYLTDVREALVRVGADHIEEVADELREWGYRYEEESN